METLAIKYNSIEAIKEAVKNGIKVNYKSLLYYVKIDFEGDFLIKCTYTPMQELLSDNHDIKDFFTTTKTSQKPTKRQIAKKQIELQTEIQSLGFNIVTCGNCGSILLHKVKDEKIECFCGTHDLSDCPDLWYEGAELSAEFDEK